jgi:hypothetical protein
MMRETSPDMAAAGLPAREQLHAILSAGIRAPSAENRHYLRFDLSTDHVDLLSTDTATWPEQPHRRMLDLLSYGAVVENMRLQATTSGLAQHTQWFPSPQRPELMATCRWAASAEAPDPLSTAIEKRHTNRHFYTRRPLTAAERAALSAAVDGVPGARLVWLDDGPARKTALRVLRVAESERFRRRALHEELFGAVRFELGWRRSAAEGLPPGALAVEAPARPAFAALRHWGLMRPLSRLGLHHLLGLRAAHAPCAMAPALGMLLNEQADASAAAVGAGRALQRVWLAAAAGGMAFQPMAAAPALLRQRAGGGWVGEAAQKTIREALQTLSGGHADDVFMLFRLGHARAPEVTTERPALDRFL